MFGIKLTNMYMIVIYLKIKIDDNLLYECPSCSCIYKRLHMHAEII